jgi:hypothetical protein
MLSEMSAAARRNKYKDNMAYAIQARPQLAQVQKAYKQAVRTTTDIYEKGNWEIALMGIVKNDEDRLCAYGWT